jgi:hypothetical protein
MNNSQITFSADDLLGGAPSAAPSRQVSANATGAVGDFVRQYLPVAERVGKVLGVEPQVLLGQWGLETGWGKSVIPGTNNLGNIKDFSGAGVGATDNMTGSRDKYRAYKDADAFADDFSGLVGRRYRGAMGTGGDANKYFSALKDGGYAEDPAYIQKGVSAANLVAGALGAKPAPSSAEFYGKPGHDRYIPIQKAPGPATAGDYAKELGASAVDALGSVLQLPGEIAAAAANKATGTEDYEGFNPLKGLSDSIRGSMTEGGKQARIEAAIKGDFFDPSSWETPPTAQGWGMVAANGFGSLASTLLPFVGPAARMARLGTALKAAEAAGDAAKVAEITAAMRSTAATAKVVGAAAGGATTGGAAAGEARENVSKAIGGMTHEQLLAEVPAYAEVFNATGDQQQARSAVVNSAARWAGGLSAVAGAAGGAFNAKVIEDALMHKGLSAMVGNSAASRAGRAVVGGAGGAVAEGGQELTEKVGQNVGENLAMGRPATDNATRDTAGDVIAGAMVGGAMGGPVGAASNPSSAPAATPLDKVIEKAAEPDSPLSRAAVVGGGAQQAAAAAAPPAEPKVDPISERAAEIQQRLRDGNLLSAMRAEDAPINAKAFLDNLALATSPSTPVHQREQAITRLDVAMQWAEQRAPAPRGERPTIPQLREGADRDAELLAQREGAGIAQEADLIDGQRQANLEQRMRAPVAPPAAARPEASPAPITDQEQANLEAAARNGQRTVEDAPRQAVINQVMRRIEERGGVASPEEAQILAEANLGKPYDRIDESLRAPLTTDQRLTQATGIALDKAPRSSVSPANQAAEAAGQAAEARAREDSIQDRAQVDRDQRRMDTSIASMKAATPAATEAPTADASISALKTIPSQRTAEQQVTLRHTRAARTADQMRILELAANAPHELSATDKLQLEEMRSASPGQDAPRQTAPASGAPFIRKRREQLDQMAEMGFDTVERRGGKFVLRHTTRDMEMDLDGPADAQLARAAIKAKVDRAASRADGNPSDARIAAENYRKGEPFQLNGVTIRVENPRGSVRRSKPGAAKKWETEMVHHYGDIVGTVGADGDKVDVFVGPRPDSHKIFVIDQQNQDGSFDEHKVMMGFGSEEEARAGYLANYEPGWTGLQAITEMTPAQFREWVKSDAAKVPAVSAGGGTLTVNNDGEMVTLPLINDAMLPDEQASNSRGRKRARTTKRQAAELRKVAAIFGKKLQFFEDPSRKIQSDGFVRPDARDTVYLNTSSTISPLAVLGHELTHIIKAENSEAYESMARVVSSRIKDMEGFREAYGGEGMSDAALLEELVSDLNGDLMRDQTFWREVFGEIEKAHGDQSKGIIARLAELIYRVVDGAIAAFKSGPGFGSSQFIDDSKEVRAAFRDGLAAYIKQSGITRTAMDAEILRAAPKKSPERGESLGDFRKRMLDEMVARREYAAMLARQHDWAFNVGDTLFSTQTGKSYRLVDRFFGAERIKKGQATKYIPKYVYESGKPPPAGANAEEEKAWPHDWQRGTFDEHRILESGTMKSLTTPLPPKLSPERKNIYTSSSTESADREQDHSAGGLGQEPGAAGDRAAVPSYGRPREGAVTAVARHYSGTPRRELSTGFAGTGLKGAERQRIAEAADARLRQRLNFYIDTGAGITPEAGVGGFAHEVRLTNLYDPRSQLIPPMTANEFEAAVLDAGFDGYINPEFTSSQAAAVLLGEHAAVPVAFLGDQALLPDAADAKLKKGLLAREIGEIDLGNIPGASMRAGTLSVPEGQAEAANKELARIGSSLRFSRERLPTPREQFNEVAAKYRNTDEWMRAPNGNPSALSERQWVQVRTPSFKAWFGDWEKFAREHGPSGVWHDDKGEVSKVVDKNGEPMVVYHGTSGGGFAKFEGASGTVRGQLGIFTTPSKAMAESYARRGRKTDIDEGDLAAYEDEEELVNGTYALFMNLRKPYEYDFEGANWDGTRPGQSVVEDSNGDTLYTDDGRGYFDDLDAAQAFADKHPGAEVLPAPDAGTTTDDEVRQAMRLEADGAVLRAVIDDGGASALYMSTPEDLFVAFKPDQVKSADFNIGTYEAGDDDIRFSRERKLQRVDPMEVSTRAPYAKATKTFEPEDPMGSLLISNFEAGLSQPKWLSAVSEVVEQYPNYREAKTATTPERKLERLVRQMHENLLWLHHQVPTETRERSKLWYDGARKIAERMAKKYDVTPAQAAGILAVLSPQKDWFMNVSLADRVAQVMAERQAFRWSKQMGETANRIFGGPAYAEDLAEVSGRSFEELDGDHLRGMWLRIYDEAHNPRSFFIVSPEGDMVAEARTAQGELAKPAWGSTPTIAKAISIYRDGSFENINEQLGRKHKVRNFFNNILVPNSENGHVTIDTHAVAAALLRPLSGNSIEVMHNFGGPSSAHAGLEGTYALYEEAYHRAARQVGLLPRELQSITWEAVRGLFTPRFKGQAKNVAAIDKIWNQYRKGRLRYEHARDETLEAAGGIEAPGWAGRDPGAYVGEEPAADTGDVRGNGLAGQEARAAAGGGDRVDPAAAAGGRPVDGDGGGRPARGSAEALPGAPTVDGATGPDGRLVEVAERYARDNGIDLRRQAEYVDVDPARAARIAAAYEAMPHAPQDPKVREAYENLIRQTVAQYRALEAAGYRFFLFDEKTDPYAGNPWNAMRDLRANQSMGVFATEAGFGSGDTELDVADNPLLADTGIRWPFGSLDGKPKRVLANDLFRAVHDAFGHGREGSGFRARGEENAWQAHVRLFTGSAVGAITSETRGQNSWLNYGPHGEANRTASVESTVFADQKTGLMPEWTWSEGVAGDEPPPTKKAAPSVTKSSQRDFADTEPAVYHADQWSTPAESRFDDLVYKLQDKHIDTKRVVDEIKKTAGELADDVDVYLQEELFHGRAAKRTEDFVQHELRPLVEAMAKDGLTIEQLDHFLHARHAREANAVIAQRNPEIQDGGSGMLNQDAEAYFAELPAEQREKLERAAAGVDAILAKTRTMMADYELESKAKLDSWAEMFDHYVPLMREDEGGHTGGGTGQGFSIKGKEVKSRTGSTRKVVDIFANIAMQRERTIVRGEKNRVSRALFGLAASNENPEFWTVDTHIPSEKVYNPASGQVEDRPDGLFRQRPNVVVTKIADESGNVTERAVIFNEKNERAVRMAEALKNLDAAQLEGLLGASAKVTRYFAAINTQWNPVFGVVNLVRDVQAALVNLGATELKGKQREVARNAMPALRGIYADLRANRKGGQAASPWATLWEEFQEVGGQTGYRQIFATSADRAEAIKQALDPQAWTSSKLGRVFTANGALKVPLAYAQRAVKWLFDWLSDYNEAMENGIRLATYKAGLDAGLSKERAASLAKNLTTNFNRKGQAAQQAGALYAFFNASMQGSARIAQTIFTMEPGKPKTIRLSPLGKKVVYGGMLLGTLQAVAMAAAGFSEEDPPEFVRERGVVIPTGNKTYLTVPLPLGLHVIPGIGRITTEWALSGFSGTAKRGVSLMGMFAEAFNPIGNAGMSMQTLAPTVLDPLVALTENKDWSGRPIAKESSNKAMPGHLLARDTSSTIGQVLSEAINYLSGGTQYTAGVFSPTPDQIDYLIGQVTGGVGRELSKVEQTAKSVATGEDMPLYKVPLVGRFAGDAKSQASESTAFHANVDRLNEIETEIKGLRKDGRNEEANDLRTRTPEAYLITQANHAERAVQRLRREKSDLVKAGAPADQVKAVETKITERMASLNRAVEALKERATQ